MRVWDIRKDGLHPRTIDPFRVGKHLHPTIIRAFSELSIHRITSESNHLLRGSARSCFYLDVGIKCSINIGSHAECNIYIEKCLWSDRTLSKHTGMRIPIRLRVVWFRYISTEWHFRKCLLVNSGIHLHVKCFNFFYPPHVRGHCTLSVP